MFCRKSRDSAGGDKIGGNRTGVESLWKPWRSASRREVQAEADAGRARAAEGKVVANFLLLRETGKSRQVSQKMATLQDLVIPLALIESPLKFKLR